MIRLLAALALATFAYNDAGGFGLYQPEGWRVVNEGRSMRVTGPAGDTAVSEIFAGSDWPGRVPDRETLRALVMREAGGRAVSEIEISELPGFAFARGPNAGNWYLLREPGNVIVLRYDLRGSAAQVEEGREILDSFAIRTGGVAYP